MWKTKKCVFKAKIEVYKIRTHNLRKRKNAFFSQINRFYFYLLAGCAIILNKFDREAERMRYILGIVSGTDETEGVLCTETGMVLWRVLQPAAPGKIVEELTEGIPKRETAVVFSLQSEEDTLGLKEKVRKVLHNEVRVKGEHFAKALLRANLAPEEDGAVLYMHRTAGVASRKDGKVHWTGGEGTPEKSDGGSLYVGYSAALAAFAAAAGEGEETCLVRMLEAAIGMPLLETENYFVTAKQEKIASFANLVRRGAKGGDAVCLKIVKETLDAICSYLQTTAAQFERKSRLYVYGTPYEDREIIKAAIESRFSGKISVLFSGTPPILGALRGAAALLGVAPDGAFTHLFTETYSIYAK